MIRFQLLETAFGHAAIAWRGDVVVGFRLPTSAAADAERAIRRRHPDAEPGLPPPAVAAIVADVRRYFAGEAVDFARVAVDPGDGEALFADIYAHVRRLGRGETTSYGAVAAALGLGREFARDVGRAMARNPVPLFIPCHRVLGAAGALGGFSAPGGAATKRRMLALEGVVLADEVDAQRAFAF